MVFKVDKIPFIFEHLNTLNLIIIQIKMRNIRNTVADNYRSDQRNMNSKERKTNNAQHLYSQNRNHSNNNSRAQ